MKWNRFTVKTKTEAEDIVISTLAEVGIEGVEIQDKQPRSCAPSRKASQSSIVPNSSMITK